ncbi:MAG TPA: hypothetical protein VF755_10665 [Catenuloplanes sp.]|jgi:hypothetical protein
MFAMVALTALLAGCLVGVVVVAGWSTAARRRLRWLVLGSTVAVAAALTPYTVADSGAAAWYLLGVPVIAAVVPVVADAAGVAAGAADAAGAVVLTGWALLLALGVGTAFLPGGVLLCALAVAALASDGPSARARRRSSD